MSRTYYSEIHLHMTWHIRAGHRLLLPEIEPAAHDALRQKALETRGVIVHAIDGTETHVHLAVTIPPTVLISDFIGQLKGASSFSLNQTFGGSERFAWQPGYGVLSFGTRAMEWVVQYIRNQKTHHARGTTRARLEQTTAEEEPAELVGDARTPGPRGPGVNAIADSIDTGRRPSRYLVAFPLRDSVYCQKIPIRGRKDADSWPARCSTTI